MLHNYFKIAFRNILKYKAYSFINVFGLALGVAVFFIALQFTTYHNGYDGFHEKADGIYRIHQKFNDGGTTAHCSYPIKDALLADYSEIQLATSFGFGFENKLYSEHKQIIGEQILYIEPSFFDIFDVEFLISSKEEAQKELASNNSKAIITEEYAKTLFGDTDPIGQDFRMGEPNNQLNYTVFAVVKNFPEDSHFHFNLLVSIDSEPFFKTVENNWNNPVVYTYVYIPDSDKAAEFQKLSTLDSFIEKHFPPVYGGPEAHLPVMPLADIHLHSQASRELEGSIPFVLVFIVSSIGTLILLLACINFMNLTTARATRRAKEVGMRKSLGATKQLLIYQFIGEALIFSILSVVAGMILAELFLPRFNSYLQQELTIQYFNNWFTIPAVVIITIILGLVSGAYPAFVISSFSPVAALKEAKSSGKTGGAFIVRKGLVILQFIVVSLLLVTIISLQYQLRYMATIDIGYDSKNLIYVRSSDVMMEEPLKYQSFVNELRNNGAVVSAAGIAGGGYQSVDFEGMKPNERIGSVILTTSPDYAQTLGLTMISGRMPSRLNKADYDGIIFNEVAINNFGWTPEEAIGKEIKIYEGDSTYYVIGVFKDIHWNDLMSEINPMGIISTPQELYSNTMMRLPSNHDKATKEAIQAAWGRFDDGWPFDVFYTDQQIDESVKIIADVQTMMKELTYLGIFIACMGLYGLATFSTERRTKEIGIRKVLGASIAGIWQLIISEFAILVLIATTVGLGAGYLVSDILLQNFAYRISIGVEIILYAFLISIMMAIVTVSYQALKSAFVNPVNSLKIE